MVYQRTKKTNFNISYIPDKELLIKKVETVLNGMTGRIKEKLSAPEIQGVQIILDKIKIMVYNINII